MSADDDEIIEDAPIRDAALRYAALGVSVLPCCNPQHFGCGRVHARGCTSPGKRPYIPTKPEEARGEWKEFQERRADAAEVAGWYDRDPRLNVGAALGAVSGLIGLDIDALDGEELLAELSQGDLPPTWEFRTGKECGRRLLYRLPPGARVITQSFKRAGTAAEILKVMSDGSQTVMPPSVHPSGAVYAWVPGRGPGEIEPADAPAWLLAPAREPAAPFQPGDDAAAIAEGGRNVYLTRLAGAMRRVGADEEAIYTALASMNERRLDPPVEDREVRGVAKSVAKYRPEPQAVFAAPVTPEPGQAVLWRYKWASQLAEHDAQTEWLWEGFIPVGGITLMSALWKAGKTTLLSQALQKFGAGGTFLDLAIKPTKVLYVTEEMEKHWSRRRQKLGLGDHVAFHIQPFPGKPREDEWLAFINQVVLDVKNEGFGLVVFDTLSEAWPVRKENDAGEVQAALAPLRQITKAGAALLLVHHLTKAGGGNFTGSRGSGVISSFPDIILEMDRNKKARPRRGDEEDDDQEDEADDNRRRIRGKGRYEETPTKIVVHWTKDGGFTVESMQRQGEDEQKKRPAPLVGGLHDGTVRRVLNALPDDPARAMTCHAIDKAVDGWVQSGQQKAFMIALQTAQLVAIDLETPKRTTYYRTDKGRAVAQGGDGSHGSHPRGYAGNRLREPSPAGADGEQDVTRFPDTVPGVFPMAGTVGTAESGPVVPDETDEAA